MRILIRGGLTLELKYFGKFKFIFKYNLGYESGDRRVLLKKKNRSRKSRASVALRIEANPIYKDTYKKSKSPVSHIPN
jgi:hypothetical protein